MNISDYVRRINSSPDQAILIDTISLGTQKYFLLGNGSNKVSYDNHQLKGMAGIGIQIDNDWGYYRLDFIRQGGHFIYEGELSATLEGPLFSKSEIIVGTREMIDHLRKTPHWETGAAFKDKIDRLLAIVDICANNRLK